MLRKLGYTIAILDSGIGGISILKQLLKLNVNFIYFADNEYMPYGKRSNEELSVRLDKIIDLLREKYQVDKIIVACNTASTILQGKYEDVVTMKFDSKNTYLATELTKKNLKNCHIIADSTLASLIEKYIFDKSKLNKIIKKHIERHKLYNLRECVLGCTHYELVADIFKKYCPNTKIICNSEFVLNDILDENILNNNEQNIYFITTKSSIEYVDTMYKLIKGE